MTDPTDLRAKACLYRRLASIPTTSGARADHALPNLAERLDRQAAELTRLEVLAGRSEEPHLRPRARLIFLSLTIPSIVRPAMGVRVSPSPEGKPKKPRVGFGA